MGNNSEVSHNQRLDRIVRIATDNVMNKANISEYNPTPPPTSGFFLLLDSTYFLLLNGDRLELL